MLETEFRFYKEHQSELIEKYGEKYVVIVGEEVIGAYDTQTEAFDVASEEHEVGTFLIQFCTPGDEALTSVFHSRVVV